MGPFQFPIQGITNGRKSALQNVTIGYDTLRTLKVFPE